VTLTEKLQLIGPAETPEGELDGGIGIGRNEAGAQDGVAARRVSQDCRHDAEHEPSKHLSFLCRLRSTKGTTRKGHGRHLCSAFHGRDHPPHRSCRSEPSRLRGDPAR